MGLAGCLGAGEREGSSDPSVLLTDVHCGRDQHPGGRVVRQGERSGAGASLRQQHAPLH